MTPILSIVIPVYNMQDTVLKAVCSGLNQAYVDVEVVVLDDGSTDRTRAVVEALQDNRVRVLSIEHAGLAGAFNAGVDAACGKYVYCIGADDWLEPDSAWHAVNLLEAKPEIGFVYGSVQYHNDAVWRYDPPGYTDGYFNQHYSAISGYIYRREAWLKGCRYRENTIADWDHILQLIDMGYRGEVVPVLMFHYWLRLSSGHLSELKARREEVFTHFKQQWPLVTAVGF